MSSKVGILMQGVISDWTEKIVREYQSNFPDASILVSTWTTENTERIPCEIIKVEPPQQTQPYQSNVNHQKVGTLAGLERMSCDLVMKTRTDQFVHNKDIFKIYEEICNKEKIMIPNYATIETMDYFASDFCQIATKDVLVNYWNSIKEYDGTFLISHAEIYLTENYVLREKKDTRPWKECLQDYFCVQNYHSDFQIEWKKLQSDHLYQKIYEKWYPKCVKPEK